jgi:hypothetical protein
MTGRVKGDTLIRMWHVFGQRGHADRVAPLLSPHLFEQLRDHRLLAHEWYPVESYLAIYSALRRLAGDEEVVATACASVTWGLRQGSWRVFVPILAGLAPETFCQRAVKRFEMVYRITFTPGEAAVETLKSGGADVMIRDTPWHLDPAWRGGVSGSLHAIPRLASFESEVELSDEPEGVTRFRLRWRKRR